MQNSNQPFPITVEQIDLVVQKFYAKIRVHPVLGPIFNGVLSTNTTIWEIHEDKISRFWRNILLRENVYSGNPAATHTEIPDIKPEHFAIWLDLFDTVLVAELPEETATLFSAKARQIGKGLQRSVSVLNG